MPRKQGDSGLPKIKKLTKKQKENARKPGYGVGKGSWRRRRGIWVWFPK